VRICTKMRVTLEGGVKKKRGKKGESLQGMLGSKEIERGIRAATGRGRKRKQHIRQRRDGLAKGGEGGKKEKNVSDESPSTIYRSKVSPERRGKEVKEKKHQKKKGWGECVVEGTWGKKVPLGVWGERGGSVESGVKDRLAQQEKKWFVKQRRVP